MPHSRESVNGRIERVEAGLRSGIAVEGRPAARWTLAERMARYRVPGVSVAVINDGTVEWAKGYGVTEAGGPQPVTTETLFQTASISKPVAALGALHLVEQGLLDLDEDVNAKLVSWQVPDNGFTRDKKVTLRGLLSHYAGLTVHGFEGYAAGLKRPTLRQVLDGVPPANSEPVRVDIAPGTVGRYSGGGYSVMQQLCIDVTGQPFADWMEETVLRPIGMTRSTFGQPLPPELLADAAKGHGVDGGAVAGGAHIYPELAAAGLWTTPSDLAWFALEIQEAFAGRSDTVISQSLAGQLLTTQWRESQPSPHPLLPPNMGLGLFLAHVPGGLYFSHSGGNEGYRSQLIALRDGGQGAVVMTNGNLGMMLITEILFSIAAEYDWPDFEGVTWASLPPDASACAAYTGRYESSDGRAITVTLEEGHLIARADRWGGIPIELHRVGETDFFITELPDHVGFSMDDQGSVVGIRFGDETAAKVA